MDPRVYPGSHTAGNGAHQQLHHLCRKMLEHGVDAKDPHLAPIIEEKVKAKLTTSKLLLNKSQSAHEDATIHEFSVAEKIKKYLVSFNMLYYTKKLHPPNYYCDTGSNDKNTKFVVICSFCR